MVRKGTVRIGRAGAVRYRKDGRGVTRIGRPGGARYGFARTGTQWHGSSIRRDSISCRWYHNCVIRTQVLP